jgi:hypothetical protein
VRPSSTLDRLDLDDVVVEQGRNATGPVAVEEVLRDEDDSLEDGVLTEGDLARPRIGLAEPLGADEETTLRWHHPRAAQLTLEPAATHHLAGERAELDARTTVSRGRRSRREPGGRPALREHQHLLGARPGSRPPHGAASLETAKAGLLLELRSTPGPGPLWSCGSYSPARISDGRWLIDEAVLSPDRAQPPPRSGDRTAFESWPFLALAL